jgi:tetratricopeptide (TPR) repeat protein
MTSGASVWQRVDHWLDQWNDGQGLSSDEIDRRLRELADAGESSEVELRLRAHFQLEGFLRPGSKVQLMDRCYTIENLLARGGEPGTWLYRAHEVEMAFRPVVLKTVVLRRDAQTASLARRQQELTALLNAEPAGVSPLYSFGEFTAQGERLWGYALRYEPNALSWSHFMDGSVPPHRVLERATRLAEEIARLHRYGVIHGDLHPGNVLVDQDRILLVDLGLARARDHPGQHFAGGAKPYAAPEVWKDKEISQASDLYSFGVLLVEGLIGARLPGHPLPDPNDVLPKIRVRLPAELQRAADSWMPQLADLLARTLAEVPKDRFAGCEQLLPILRRLLRKWTEILEPNPTRDSPLPGGADPKEFVGRDKDLEAVGRALQRRGIVWVHAEGGMGKSELARQYVLRQRDQYTVCLWADGGISLAIAYGRFAADLGLPEEHLEKASERVQAVRAWLARTPNWLLVIDNLDDPEVLRQTLEHQHQAQKRSTSVPSPFLPEQHRGHVFITSRNSQTGWMPLPTQQIYRLQKLSQKDAADYVLRNTGREWERLPQTEQSGLSDLLKELDGLPLALEQVASYIRGSCSFAEYWASYQKQKLKLLGKGMIPSGYPETVATTWTINFEAVEEQNPAAADLLKYLAYLAPDGTPWELFLESENTFPEPLGTALRDTQMDPILWTGELLRALRRFSLVAVIENTRLLQIHRLVQQALGDRILETEGETGRRARAKSLTESISPRMPSGHFEHSAWWQRWLQVAEGVAQVIVASGQSSPAAASLLSELASWYVDVQGSFAKAEPLCRQALAMRQQLLGKEHPHVATSLSNLAELYRSEGCYEEAEPLFRQVLAMRQKLLGKEHPDVAASLNNLAFLYTSQGRYEEAEPLFQEALAMHQQLLGKEHPHVATSLNNLAELYRSEGRYEEAEPLFREALAIFQQLLGKEHPHVATSLNNLAELYRSEGRYELAEPLLREELSSVE